MWALTVNKSVAYVNPQLVCTVSSTDHFCLCQFFYWFKNRVEYIKLASKNIHFLKNSLIIILKLLPVNKTPRKEMSSKIFTYASAMDLNKIDVMKNNFLPK